MHRSVLEKSKSNERRKNEVEKNHTENIKKGAYETR